MKNKVRIIISIIIVFFFNNAFSNEEINYSSNIIKILENGKIISGEGDVQILIGENIFISSEKFKYDKKTGLYKIFDNVYFRDKKITLKHQEQNLFCHLLITKYYQKQKLKLFITRLTI